MLLALFYFSVLAGFPILLLGFAFLFLVKFQLAVSSRAGKIIFIDRHFFPATSAFQLTFAARNWLARHEHSPSPRRRGKAYGLIIN